MKLAYVLALTLAACGGPIDGTPEETFEEAAPAPAEDTPELRDAITHWNRDTLTPRDTQVLHYFDYISPLVVNTTHAGWEATPSGLALLRLIDARRYEP